MSPPAPIHDLVSTLTSLLPLLDAFAHRNKNQHRRSHWWSHFSILRSNIRDLCRVPVTKKDDASYAVRAKRLSAIVVPRCYVKFTQLAADNQFAPLGLVLLAVLAQVHAALQRYLPNDEHPPPKATVIKQLPSQNTDAYDSVLDKGTAVTRDKLTTHALPTKPLVTGGSSPGPDMEEAPLGVQKTKQKDKVRKTSKKGGKKKSDALSTLFGAL